MNKPRAPEDRDERLESLYRNASREEPPARVDRSILAAAREAGAQPRFFVRPLLPAWRVPVAVAAAVVVSVSVVTLIIEEEGGSLSRYPESEAVTRPVESAAPRAPSAVSPPAAHQERHREGAAAARAPATTPAAPEAAAVFAEKSAPAAAPQPKRDAPRELRSATPASGAEPPASPAQAESSADATSPALKRSLPERSGNEAVTGGRYAAPQSTAAAAAKAAPAAIPPAVLRELEGQSPEKWLERIEALQRQGEVVLADALRTEFRRRFPDHPGVGVRGSNAGRR